MVFLYFTDALPFTKLTEVTVLVFANIGVMLMTYPSTGMESFYLMMILVRLCFY